jgi:hypothetical protein
MLQAMALSKAKVKVCYIPNCGKPARRKRLCAAHAQAHFERDVPIEELIRRMEEDGLEDRIPAGEAVDLCMARATKEEAAAIDAAVKAGRIPSRYAWLRRLVREGVKDL